MLQPPRPRTHQQLPPPQPLVAQRQPAQRVLSVRVDAGVIEHEIRAEAAQHAGQHLGHAAAVWWPREGQVESKLRGRPGSTVPAKAKALPAWEGVISLLLGRRLLGPPHKHYPHTKQKELRSFPCSLARSYPRPPQVLLVPGPIGQPNVQRAGDLARREVALSVHRQREHILPPREDVRRAVALH